MRNGSRQGRCRLPLVLATLLASTAVLLAVGCGAPATSSSPAKTDAQTPVPNTPVPNTPVPTATVVKGFVNPDLLVESDWLAQKLSDASIRIVDARTPDEYKAGHIKGAVSIPVNTTFLATGPSGIVGSPEQIAELFGGKGISNDTRVIVYDGGKDTKASRILWTLEYYGHKKVSVLNGGFKKWQKESKEIATTDPAVTAATLTVKAEPARNATMAEVKAAIGKSGVAIVDARSPEEYRGEDVRTKRGGRVPGAVNIDWRTLFTADDTFKSAADLAKMYQDQGVTKDKEVHAY